MGGDNVKPSGTGVGATLGFLLEAEDVV